MREPLPQQVQRAATVLQRRVEHLHDPVKQLALLLGDVAGAGLDDLLQLLGLRLSQPREHVLGEQRALTVVASVSRGVQPAVGGEVLADLLLELDLVVLRHLTPPQTGSAARTSICPVTAAVISAAPALTRELDEPLASRDQGVDLRRLLVEIARRCGVARRGAASGSRCSPSRVSPRSLTWSHHGCTAETVHNRACCLAHRPSSTGR